MIASITVRWLLPILSGGILVFAFPGWNAQIAVWLWLFPLLAVLWPVKATETHQKGSEGAPGSKKRTLWSSMVSLVRSLLRSGFAPAYVAGLAFFIPNLFWIRHSSRVMLGGARDDSWAGWGPELLGYAALIGLAGYCALYFGLWGWFVGRFARPRSITLTRDAWWPSTLHSLACSFLAAGAWVACEWLRSTTVFTGFGWNGLGVAFHRNLVLIQAADMVGVMGLSFLPVFVACTAWNSITRFYSTYHGQGTCRSRLDFTLALILVLGTGSYGMLKLAAKPSTSVKIRTAMIQPNVSQADAMSGAVGERTYERLRDFTRMYAPDRDLVVWPESALPVNLYDLKNQLPGGWHAAYFNELLELSDFRLLTGTEIYPPDGTSHVSAVLFHGDYQNRQEHHKVHLVPFGEYLPLREYWPFSILRPLFPGDFDAGQKTEPLKFKDNISIIPLICFEDTVGRVARRFVREEPQMIVAISNDGWFINSIETEMHLANAIFRAVELHRPMLRCSNIGVTCLIDEHGQVTSRLEDPVTHDSFIEGVLPGDVVIHGQEMTLYARWGDWFALVMLVITLLVIISRWKGTRTCTV